MMALESPDHQRRWRILRSWRRAVASALIFALAGCSVAQPPLPVKAHVVATPETGQLNVVADPGSSVGDVTPVYVSVANGTEIPRSVVPSQVFALNSVGERVAPLPPGEAARQAGGSGELKAALTSAAVSGGLGGVVGGGLGAAAGAAFGAVGTGSIVGAAIGGAEGIFTGAEKGQTAANRQADQQITSLALRQSKVYKGFTQSGYVFFPKGEYTSVETVLVNDETGDTEDVKTPW
jgi:hypothetical protein